MDLPVTIGEVENIISYTYIFEHVLHTHIHTHTHTHYKLHRVRRVSLDHEGLPVKTDRM